MKDAKTARKRGRKNHCRGVELGPGRVPVLPKTDHATLAVGEKPSEQREGFELAPKNAFTGVPTNVQRARRACCLLNFSLPPAVAIPHRFDNPVGTRGQPRLRRVTPPTIRRATWMNRGRCD